MWKKIERNILRFSLYDMKLLYSEYVDILSKGFNSKSTNKKYYDYYKDVFIYMTGWKKDFFSLGNVRVFIIQLLTGCRYSEVESLVYNITDTEIIIHVKSIKGTGDRIVSYDRSIALISHLCELIVTDLPPINYKSHYKSLYRSNGNFYIKFEPGHLNATHAPRHLFVQVLYYVLNISKDEVQRILSWHRDDTIESYIDKDLFKIFVRGDYIDRFNKRDNRESVGRDSGDRSDSNIGKKNTTKNKKKVKKKKKE